MNTFSRTGEVLRDIARGGIAGAFVGTVVGGLGGRLVMRLAAILHADTAGALTENGNRIGEVTLLGTLGLVAFGMVAGLFAGTVWVIVSPWIPGRLLVRALATAGLAIATGTPSLVIGTNPDFRILDHDAIVVAVLVALIGLMGLSIALVDEWLDRRMPHVVPGRTGPAVFYAFASLLGAVLVFPFVMLVLLDSDEYQIPIRAGLALLVVILCTATWWGLRAHGQAKAPRGLVVAARGALLVAAVLGVLTSLPHISRALGAPS